MDASVLKDVPSIVNSALFNFYGNSYILVIFDNLYNVRLILQNW